MALKTVKTQQEANAVQFLKDQSTVLHTLSSNEIKVNGVNVIVKSPQPGDVMCTDADKNIIFIKGDTVNVAEWPTEDGEVVYDPIAVCYKVRGGKAYCRYKSETARRWAEADRFQASSIPTGSGTLSWTINANGCANRTISFSRSSSAHDTCLNINNALKNLGANNTSVCCQYVGPHDYDPVDANGQYTGNDGVMIFSAKFQEDAWNNITISGTSAPTLTRCIGRDIPADSTNFRQNGGSQYWGGANFYRFYDYYRENGGDDTALINTGTPCKESVFNGNAALKHMYGTYKNYLRSCMVQWPTAKGANGRFFNKGHEFTMKLDAARYCDMSATPKGALTYLYGPAHYCATEVAAETGLPHGTFWLPSSGEMIELMADITYGTTEFQPDPEDESTWQWDKLDPVNSTIYRLNANSFDVTKGFNFELLSASGPNLGNYLLYGHQTSSYGAPDALYYYGVAARIPGTWRMWSSGYVMMPITSVNISQ